MQTILSDIPSKKIEIKWNKNPIPMEKFLSFLTVKAEFCKNFSGLDHYWTRHYGDNGLVLSGGILSGIEYLDRIEYKEKLANKYNNFVNPFYLFEIMNDEGKQFFLDYYKDEIQQNIDKATKQRLEAEQKLQKAAEFEQEIIQFWKSI